MGRTVTMEGKTTITVGVGGTGLDVSGGMVTMEGGLTIKASGMGTTGVSVSGGEVMMNDVNISNFATGITMTGGRSLTVERGSIVGNGRSGVGINVTGGSGNVMVDGVEISKFATGIDMKAGESLTVEGGTRITVGRGGTGVKVGNSVTMTSLTDVTITGSGSGEGNGGGMGVWVMGGEVKLTRVNVSNVGMGIYMTGGETLTVSGGEITGVKMGITMMGSGEFTVSGGTIGFEGTYGYGVMVGDMVTRTELTGVTITGSGKGGVGVKVSGGNATLTRVGITLQGGGTGIMMEAGESLTVKEGTIQFAGDYGIKLGSSVTMTELTGVTIEGNKSGGNGVGIYAEGKNLTVKGTTTITGVKVGIMMKGSGVLKVEEGTKIEFKEDGIGMYVGSAVTKATLTGVTIEGKGSGNGNGYGVLMTGTGNATLTRVDISNVATGIYATGGKNLTVIGGEIKGVEKGITMMGGALTVKKEAKINFTGEHGIKLGKGVTEASLMGVMIEGQNKGVGIYAEGKNLTVIGGEIKGVEDGIMMKGSGELKVRDNTKIWFTKDYGIKLGKGVTEASLTKVEIVGNNKGKGVVWESTGTLTLDEVKISGVGEGLYAVRGEALKVDGGSIGFTGTYGVMVGNAVTSATLTNVQIMGSNRGKTGVVMGSTGMLTSVNISGVQTGVEVAGSGKLTINEGTIGFTDVGLRVEGEDATTVTVTGTKITGEGNNGMMSKGVYVGNSKAVTLTRVGISQVEMGVQVKGSGSLTINEGTTIQFKGSYGVSVGNSVTANLKGATITGEGGGTGVWAKGGTVMMEKVDISNVGMGVYAEGGVLMVSGGSITGVKMGIMMKGSGVLKVSGGTRIEFMAGGTGVYVGKSVTANLKGTVIRGSGNNGVGVYTVGGKVLTMTKVDISNVGTGVGMSGGTLIMKDGEIGFMRAYGVAIEGGAAALMGVTMRYKGDNKVKGADVVSPSFIKVDGRGANLAAIKVMITGNEQGLGVKVANGGHVTLKQSHIPIQSTIHITHNLIL
ncbi:right-handed parallel beta-helix repeat-containing protein [Bartonella schoenbuchensis]|uniref:right-handed parallel beta-helix repeat-containing protein n=1 Tax=Bartonella schoenbuchensis TaxID=165694 RepID=UPI0031454698